MTFASLINQFKARIALLYGSNDGGSTWSPQAVLTTPSSLAHKKVTVGTAGSPVQVSTASIETSEVFISGDTDVGIVLVVGGSNTVRATVNNKNGMVIIPGNTPVIMRIDNLNKLWVDSETDGGILCVSYSSP